MKRSLIDWFCGFSYIFRAHFAPLYNFLENQNYAQNNVQTKTHG